MIRTPVAAGFIRTREDMNQKYGQWLLVIMSVAVLLRFALLGSNSLWFDEAFSITQASRPQAEIWQHGSEDHPPLYYSILHDWLKLAGRSEIAARFPSAVISLISQLLLYLLSRRLFGQEVALVAVSLLAFSPLDVWYAREVRMYIFVTFIGLLMALGLVWRNRSGMLLFGAGLAAGLYLDYTIVPLWIGLSAIWLSYWWTQGYRFWHFLTWFLPSLAAWMVYYPWLPNFYHLLERLNRIFVFNQVRSTLGLSSFTAPQYLLILGLLGVGLAILAGLLLHLLRYQKMRYALIPVFLLGFAMLTLLYPLPRFYSIKRVIVTGWPFVVLLVAWLVTQLERPRQSTWFALMGLSLLASVVMILGVPKDDWRGVVAYLDQYNVAAADIWLDPPWNRLVYTYYRPQQPPTTGSLQELEEVAARDVWFVAERFPGQPVPASPSEAWLDEHLELVKAVSFYRLEVRHYRPRTGAVQK